MLDVVGDANVGAEVDELVERRALGRVGVRRREHPQPTAGLAVPAQAVEQRTDPAAADEGHHDVDRVGRLDLRPQLAPQRRLARRVGEQGRVEQRDQRHGHRRRRSVGVATPYRLQDRSRLDRASLRGPASTSSPSRSRSARATVTPTRTRSSSLTSSSARSTWRLTCQAIRSAASPPSSGRSSTGSRSARSSSWARKALGDEQLVEARSQLRHGPTLGAPCDGPAEPIFTSGAASHRCSRSTSELLQISSRYASRRAAFSEFLRQPDEVVADLADHDVVLRRRNAPALRLSEAEREEERDEAFDALARLLRNLLIHRPAGLESTIDEAFPWATFLPRQDRKLFIDELTRTLLAVSTIDNFAPVGQLLREWKATAEIHADPRLARRLRRRVDADGEAVQAPAG